MAQISLSTTFEQLPEDVRRIFINTQANIIKNQQSSEAISQHSVAPIKKFEKRIQVLHEQYNSLLETLKFEIERASEFCAQVRNVERELDHLNIITRAPNLQAPPKTLPSSFFLNLIAEFENRMQQYRIQIEEIERVLSTNTSHYTVGPSIIAEIIRYQNDTFLNLASQIIELNEKMSNLKRDVIQISGHDPFVSKEKAVAKQRKETTLLLPPATPGPAGTPSNTPGNQFNFNTSTPSPSGFGFGAGTPSGGTGATSSFSFSGGSSTPFGGASGTPSSGLNFGTSTTSGQTSTPGSTFSFGTGGTNTSTGGGAFNFGGASSTPSSGFSFGTNSTSGTPGSGFNFGTSGQTGGTSSGTPSGGGNGFSFGTGGTSGTPSGGFSFGTSGSTNTSTGGSGFSFSGTSGSSNTPGGSGFSFGKTV